MPPRKIRQRPTAVKANDEPEFDTYDTDLPGLFRAYVSGSGAFSLSVSRSYHIRFYKFNLTQSSKPVKDGYREMTKRKFKFRFGNFVSEMLS